MISVDPVMYNLAHIWQIFIKYLSYITFALATMVAIWKNGCHLEFLRSSLFFVSFIYSFFKQAKRKHLCQVTGSSLCPHVEYFAEIFTFTCATVSGCDVTKMWKLSSCMNILSSINTLNSCVFLKGFPLQPPVEAEVELQSEVSSCSTRGPEEVCANGDDRWRKIVTSDRIGFLFGGGVSVCVCVLQIFLPA